MIYPPEYKNSILNSEEKVFKALSQLPDEGFTTFYNQQFTTV
jgi:hypothetical protein